MKTLKQLIVMTTWLVMLSLNLSPAATLIWDADPLTPGLQDGGGTWDTTTNTWWDGSGNVVWVNGTTAAGFGVGSGAAGTVTLAVPISVPQILDFDSPGGTNYTISGSAANTLTLTGTPTISANVDAALNVVLAGEAFTKLGGGVLSLRPPANNTYLGTTLVNIGTLALNSTSSSRIVIPGDLTINLSGIVTNIGSSGPVADTATVTVNNNGTYAPGTDVISTLVLAGGTVIQSGSETFSAPTIDARSGSVNQSAGATGKVDGNLTKTTAGTVTWTARGSVSAGGLTNTIVNAGILILDYTQNNSKLADAGTLTVNGGTLVQVNGTHTETVGAVTLTGGVITNAGGTSRFSVPSGNYDVRAGAVYTVLAGAAGLAKTTAGTVILAATNTFTGGTVISAGTLQLGDGISGGLVNSSGITDDSALVLNPSGAPNVSSVITGTGTLEKIGSGTAVLTSVNSYSGITTISQGVLGIDGDATLGNGAGAIVFSPGSTLNVTASRNVTANPVANPLNFGNGAITTTSAATTVDVNFTSDTIGIGSGSITFRNDGADAASDQFEPRFSGSPTILLPIVIDNGAVGKTRLSSFNTNGTLQVFKAPISGNGSFRRSFGTGSGGVTIFSATNTYTGDTAVNNGTLLLVDGEISTGAVTVNGPGVLGGNGKIRGPVTIASGGILAPGNSTGRLTISNTLTFAATSTNVVEVSRNGSVLTNDAVRGLSSVAFGGTLVVNDLGPGALQLGDSFQLFDIGGSGNFTVSGSPGGGNAWSFNPATGVLSVVASGSVPPPPLDFAQIGNSIQFSWTNALFKLQAQTNSLTTGLVTNNSAWFNYPDGDSSPVTAPIDPATGCVFFRLSQ